MRNLYGRLHRRFGRKPTGRERRRRAEAHRERLRQVLPLDRVKIARTAGASPGSVLVIGGGFAGTSAAFFLASEGFSVTLAEANVIGGRVSTSSSDISGRLIEQGGELIGLNHALWCFYAEMFELGLSVLTTDDIFAGLSLAQPVYLDGQSYDDSQAEALYNAMTDVFTGWCSTAVSTFPGATAWTPWTIGNASQLDGQSLSSQIPGTTAQNVVDAINLTFYLNNTVDPNEQSWLANLAQFAAGTAMDPGADPLGFFDDTEVFRCENGNQSLARTLAGYVADAPGCQVLTGTAVSSIDTDGTTVTATINGEQQTFIAAIIAVPVAILPSITINGQSVSATSNGSAVKYLAGTAGRFWLANSVAPTALSDQIGMTWEGTDNQMNTGGGTELSVFAGGQVADNARNAPDADTFFQNGLNELYGSETYSPTTFMNWPSTSNIGTGYSCPSTGQVTGIQQTYASAIQGNVYIAGEHASPAWFGFMEGALESGITAAWNLTVAAGAGG